METKFDDDDDDWVEDFYMEVFQPKPQTDPAEGEIQEDL